ncbi:MAG: 1-acyl-sn-glycerol-3-phosphate acyltransferase, partial [Myxococcota bacterium]
MARFFEELRGEAYGVRLDAVRPDAIERALAVLRRVFGPGRYFEVQTKGLEQIPASPAMLVSNHSGGTSIPDAWGLAYVWFSHFGTERPLHVLAHDMVFALKWPGKSFEQLGILRASRTMGEHILDQGRDLLVMPGGDVETWRPWRDRYTLRW